MEYEHTQKGIVHYFVYLVGVGFIASAGFMGAPPVLVWIWTGAGAVIMVLGACFHRLTVRDEADRLTVRFGPVPLFGTSILYSEITDVTPDRSTLLEGWGVHYVPGRGWIYNLSGFNCVRIDLGRKVVRVGTDDQENLIRFLRAKMAGDRSEATTDE